MGGWGSLSQEEAGDGRPAEMTVDPLDQLGGGVLQLEGGATADRELEGGRAAGRAAQGEGGAAGGELGADDGRPFAQDRGLGEGALAGRGR